MKNLTPFFVGRSEREHLLVIRMSALGDVAMTLPVLKALSEKYPDLRITLLTRRAFAPLFGQLNGVAVYGAELQGRHKGVLGLWRLYNELRKFKFSGVADLHNVLRSNVLKQFFALSSIPFVQIDKGRRSKKELTSLTQKVFKPLESTHQRYASVFKKLGYPVGLSEVALLTRQPLSENVREFAGAEYRKWIGIAPFAAYPGKMYPEELMRQIVTALSNTGKYAIYLFGSGGTESEMLQSWEQQYSHCKNVAGKLGFEEELSLISNLDVMVSMDSANAHLAANYGIPTLTLWGLTHPHAGFYPFRQDPENALLADRQQYPGIPTSVYGNKMPKGYEQVMASIPPHDVILKIEEILSRP